MTDQAPPAPPQDTEDTDAAIEAIELRRAARKAGQVKQEKLQHLADLEALDELEEKHGPNALLRITLDRYIPGLPTMVIYRLPKPMEHKRYQDMMARSDMDSFVKRSQENGAKLATGLVVYPDKAKYAKVCETFTGLHMSAATEALRASAGRAEKEGKS